MTATAEVRSRSESQREEMEQDELRCEVYCSSTHQVLGYLVARGTATCLAQALERNGFSLVPISGRGRRADQPLAAA